MGTRRAPATEPGRLTVVAVPKVCGIETEFGISLRGVEDPNPVTTSSLLINAYIAQRSGDLSSIKWDFEQESPGQDARGFTLDMALAPETETGLVNVVLTNGARFYVDHAHPEYSTPECADPLALVLYEKAGERTLQLSVAAAQSALPPGRQVLVHKNNSDGKGNSYGTHENYLMDRATPFARIVAYLLPFFVTRQIYAGAGKVGFEHGGHETGQGAFQLSQRSDFFEEEVGLETTLKRPIINTRDEPHADPERFRRLHCIVGDSNMCEVANLLKVGTTSIVLSMIEDGFLHDDLGLARPVAAIRAVSHDPTLRQPIERADGGTVTALEIQWDFFEQAKKYLEDADVDAVTDEVMHRWEATLSALETEPMSLHGQLDWVAKLRLFEGYRERDGLSWKDPKLHLLDLQWHDVRPERGLYYRLEQQGSVERLVTDEAIAHAVVQPPTDTRAFFRGTCLQRFSSDIVAANWDSLVFDLGGDPLRRVPMMDPTKGTQAHTSSLFESVETAAELLDALQA
jgi:Pup amidohydrolase